MMAAEPEDSSRLLLWTRLSTARIDELLRTGFVRNARRHCSDIAPLAYDWMTDELGQRIGPAPSEACSPIWAWARVDGEIRELMADDLEVVVFRPSPSNWLLSDWDWWEQIMCRGPLLETPEEEEEFDARLELGDARDAARFDERFASDEATRAMIVENWRRVFVTADKAGRWRNGLREAPQRVQAVGWQIEAADVIARTTIDDVLSDDRFTSQID